ncbi:hypothetical protein Bca101_026774 [Brassica carinata]
MVARDDPNGTYVTLSTTDVTAMMTMVKDMMEHLTQQDAKKPTIALMSLLLPSRHLPLITTSLTQSEFGSVDFSDLSQTLEDCWKVFSEGF